MPILKNVEGKLNGLKAEPFATEGEIQTLIETNLEELLGLEFVTRQFAPRGDLRIDTLAFDPEQKSFVIIEYKRGANWSVMDQGFSYLSMLLDRKADFVLKINENHNKQLSVSDIGWENSRVIFIAPSFTTYQIGALGFQDVPFELYKLQRFAGVFILFEQVESAISGTAKLAGVRTDSEETRRVQREVKTYSLEDHFRPGYEVSRELFDELVPRLLELDNRLSVRPVKSYIGINIGRKNIFSVKVRQSGLTFHIIRFQPKDLDDPNKRIRYVANSLANWNVHVSETRIENRSDVDYAIMISRQVLAKLKF